MIDSRPKSPELQLIERCRSFEAGIMRQVYADADDHPICMVVVIDGREDCEAVIGFLESLEATR